MPSARLIFLTISSTAVARAAVGDSVPVSAGTANTAVVLGALALVAAIVALVFAIQSHRRATHAAQEAGQARARASQGGGHGVSSESLAGLERVWNAKLAAIEARLSPGGALRASVARESERAPEAQGGRLDELERVVAGLSLTVKELRRPGPAAPTAIASPKHEMPEMVWPACLAAETSAMSDVRQTLAQALKSRDNSARDLLEKLRATEQWPAKKPGASEVAAELTEISLLLHAALRRGAAVAPLDGSLLSDRVLAALRPSWKPLQPQLDCRSFYPGATFDPDWMEDHTRAGLQRPVISEMLSWAVFEKHDSGRRVLAKARITAE